MNSKTELNAMPPEIEQENSRNKPLSRRQLINFSSKAAAVAAPGVAPLLAQNNVVRPPEEEIDYSKYPKMPWPKAPFRVWYGSGFRHRDLDAYRHINVDASGETNHLIAAPLGVTTLNWTYGTNNPYSKGPESWSGAFTEKSLTRGKDTDNPIRVAGITIDEWVPNHKDRPLNEQWMVEGLRQGKKINPNCYVAAWVTHPTQAMFDVGRDGTVDLFMIENYTHLGPNLPPDWALKWDETIERCEAFKKAGLLHKTVYCFGHISPGAVSVEDGSPLTTTWLYDRMRYIKNRYPQMPGVAFFPGDSNVPGHDDMVRFVNNLAGELWPDKKR